MINIKKDLKIKDEWYHIIPLALLVAIVPFIYWKIPMFSDAEGPRHFPGARIIVLLQLLIFHYSSLSVYIISHRNDKIILE